MTKEPAGPQRLAAFVDGAALPHDEAHALWDRFSAWMDDHRGDLQGFASQEGFASVHPGVDGDRPVLRASRSARQEPYGPVRPDVGAGGGSPSRQAGSPRPGGKQRDRRDPARKPSK